MATAFSSSVVPVSDRSVLRFFPARANAAAISSSPARLHSKDPSFQAGIRKAALRGFHWHKISSKTSSSSSSASAAAASAHDDPTDSSKQAPKSLRHNLLSFIDEQSGYFWLLGPILATSALILPSLSFSLLDLLQNNYTIGLASIFALDLLFILAADAFFVLADKSGHHQKLPGTSPWIGPWNYTGYPKGLPHILDFITYTGIAAAGIALIISIFLGKIATSFAAFGPYLALILVQAAYERLLCKDKLPTYPLVATVYTMYRFKQLARAMELFTAFHAGPVLVASVKALMAVWTFYLATYLAQLPWLYCTWNANRLK